MINCFFGFYVDCGFAAEWGWGPCWIASPRGTCHGVWNPRTPAC